MRITTIAIAAFVSIAAQSTAFALTDAQAMNAFKNADANSDGVLGKTEFREFINVISKLGHANAARAVRFGAVGYGVAFRDADQDRNGLVTLNELQAIK